MTMTEQPDWVRAYLLLGKDAGGDLVPILLDADGQMYALLRGADGTGTARTVRVNSSGELYALLKGASGVDVAVDASGYLTTVLKGIDGTSTLRTLLVDASGQAIMVPRGQSGNYLNVDASGFLTAVLKGVYDGTLTTIRVDTSGRIEAFLMDGDDQWGQSIRVGNADLAARLGGLSKYDWRGQVAFQNDFSHGAHSIYTSTSGAGAQIMVTPLYWHTGGYSLWLEGGSDASGYAYFYSGIGPSPSGKVGLAISFCVVNKPDYVRIMLLHETPTQLVYGDVRLDYDNEQIQYYNGSTNAWENAGDFDSYITPYIFNNLKLVIDSTGKTYERILYNSTALTPTTIALEEAAVAGTPRLYYEVWVYSHAGDTDAICVDNVILTVNEP